MQILFKYSRQTSKAKTPGEQQAGRTRQERARRGLRKTVQPALVSGRCECTYLHKIAS